MESLVLLIMRRLLPALLTSGQCLAGQTAIDYPRDIQPLFDHYCVACHACFDAPCQLDLTHPAGVLRGASKQPVYDGTRLEAAPPTRLFIDGRSITDWREKGFFSVTEGKEAAPILLRLLDLKTANPLPRDQRLPDDVELGIRRTNLCLDAKEVVTVATDHPHLGMPFALPGMNVDEVARIRAWLEQGARVKKNQAGPSTRERAQIKRWEHWLNDARPERALVARWLFEHWAIARLYFDQAETGHFYRLVRSATPPGQAVEEIATRYPNSDPGVSFYYRLRMLPGTRIYKTHITFPLSPDLLRRIEQLFFGTDWEVGTPPRYTDKERANPFSTFSAIPADARYRFLLEHAEYFVRTFIRGPVCRGQLATDVIRDHFWVMFQTPASDPYIADPGFRRVADSLLDIPSVEDDLLEGAGAWIQSTERRNRYARLRQQALASLQPQGADIESIWDGDGSNGNALLTVFRHHDSATVKRGWLGQQPFTVWWMDYPLFERSYYNLVVNFDVFGNIAHQAQTRLYFDLIRNGAEQNFLRLLPAAARQRVLNAWYAGSGKLKLWLSYRSIDTGQESRVAYQTAEPKKELLETLLTRFSKLNATPDPINRPGPEFDRNSDAMLAALSHVPAADMPSIAHLSDATILLVGDPGDRPDVYTLIRNRRHSNVAFVLGESLRYEPEKDTLTVVPGVASAYPNFVFKVPADDLPKFVAAIKDKKLGDRAIFVGRVVGPWGVRRSSPDFWLRFHAINRYLVDVDPIEAGILDLNRYVDY